MSREELLPLRSYVPRDNPPFQWVFLQADGSAPLPASPNRVFLWMPGRRSAVSAQRAAGLCITDRCCASTFPLSWPPLPAALLLPRCQPRVTKSRQTLLFLEWLHRLARPRRRRPLSVVAGRKGKNSCASSLRHGSRRVEPRRSKPRASRNGDSHPMSGALGGMPSRPKK